MDFSDELMSDFTVRKQVLWEAFAEDINEVNQIGVEFIRKYQSNNPKIVI